MKNATYIVIKDNTKKHPEKMVFKHGAENAYNYFYALVEQGLHPVCYRKNGMFGRVKEVTRG